MNQHKVKWQGRTVTLRTHSELDDIARAAMEAMIERTLEVYQQTKCDDPILLSQYGKGHYCYLARELGEGYEVDFFVKEDYENHNLPEDIVKEVDTRITTEPVAKNAVAVFPVSQKKMPW
jgi:CTP:phosphocholine cytidylyltransferase-like protein